MHRIFITGCARSGTTLLNRLFYSFCDTEVIDNEIDLEHICNINSDKSYVVGKRTPLTLLSVPLAKTELQRQLKMIKAYNVSIINIVRDGRDVVHKNPDGPRVNINRWIGSVLQSYRFRDIIRVAVTYEDLVNIPDSVQTKIANAFGFRIKYKFSEYPKFVPKAAFDEPEYKKFIYYRSRPIDTISIGHSSNEYIKYCTCAKERELFERILKRLNYISGFNKTGWDESSYSNDQRIFRELSIRLGYFNKSEI